MNTQKQATATLILFHLQEPMVGLFKRFAFLFLLINILFLTEVKGEYLKIQAQKGDGINILLNRYNVAGFPCSVDTFLILNGLKRTDHLQLARTYRLPIYVYDYNDVSIRTTINNNNYDRAVFIQKYNEEMLNSGLRDFDYRSDKQLWVPVHALFCLDDGAIKKELIIENPKGVEVELSTHKEKTEQETTRALRTEIFPIFGENYEKTPIYTEKLKGQIYYLISGHGGPDPGAIGYKDGHMLCEDEYAYDVTLRFARNLLQHGATVYVITRDEDGIRDDEFLKSDHDETAWFNQTMPINQARRLKQRTSKINELYEKHQKEGATIQRVIEIHIDSRYEEQKVDIFFYYYPGSQTGKDLAIEMYSTVKAKYDEHQTNRGYRGVVRSRDLHTLRECKPPVVYVELGNITNEFDQKRLLIVNNRQAIANWFTLGILSKNGE
jgi:N-acetylmuramoyl-L-alanine amidase